MKINVDFSRRVVVDTTQLQWMPSAQPGVERRLIERDGEEVALATSIVRYAPGATFASHVHRAGEEILVLEGELRDEFGSYAPGTYVRNPPGSSHQPSTEVGCTLLVKLRHLDLQDTQRVVVDATADCWRPGLVPGLSVLPLAEFGTEGTALVRWAPGTRFRSHRHFGGEEIYVLDGTFCDEHGAYPSGTWIRSPHLSQHAPFTVEGCTIFVKTGHLPSSHG